MKNPTDAGMATIGTIWREENKIPGRGQGSGSWEPTKGKWAGVCLIKEFAGVGETPAEGATGMYEDAQEAVQKIRQAIPNLRAFKRASLIGVHLPVGDALDTFLPTYLYIAIVSLLHDALREFIKVNYPRSKPENFGTCIDILSSRHRQKRLKNPDRMRAIKDMRDAFAHEVGVYASWNDLDTLLQNLDEELQYLGVLGSVS